MSATDPRECCWACELDADSCRDLFCSCHDFIVCVDPDEHAPLDS